MNLVRDKIKIRKVQNKDLEKLWEVSYRDNLEWTKWNGPYFNDPLYDKNEFIESIGPKYYLDTYDTGLILYDETIIGIASYNFIDGNIKRWIEFGLVIYDESLWGKGLGTNIAYLWIDYIFESYPHIPHVGFTTWSGNIGMMSIGEKLNMTLEARIRSVRFYKSQYWDSIKYGILREEFYNK